MKAEQLRINPERLMTRLNRLAEIGRTEDGGCCRLALTDEDRAGRDLVVAWMRDLGLEVAHRRASATSSVCARGAADLVRR